MKRIIALLLVAILLAPFSADAAKKKTRRKSSAAPTASVVVGPEKNYADGLVTRTYSIKKKVRVETIGGAQRMDCSLSMEYPVGGPEAVVNAMRRWIKGEIGEKYPGSIDDPQAMAKWVASQWSDIQENIEIKVAYANDKIVTLSDNSSAYMGGAHGASALICATFRLSDGRILTNADMPRFSQWNIARKLADVFECSTADVVDILFNGIPSEYPERNPYILADGAHITWGEYEIAPYAAGIIDVVLSNNPADFAGTPAAAYF